MAIQSEKSGAGQSEEFVASRVQEIARRSEKDEGLLQTQCQFADHTAENVALGLNREDDWHGLARPGTNLTSVGDGEIILAGIQTESLANGATEFRPIEVQRCNFGNGEGERSA